MQLIRSTSSLLRARDFALLMLTQYASQMGDGIVQIAIAKLIVFGGQRGFDLEGARSPDEVLRIALYLFIPYTLLSPFLGVLIDRWDRRRLLISVNALRAVIIGAVGVIGIAAIGDALFGAFLLTLACTRLVLATKAAALPVTVGESELVSANAISQLGGALCQLGGAGAAFLLAGLVNVEIIVIGGAVVYGAGWLSATLLGRIGELRRKVGLAESLANVIRGITEGLREVRSTPAAGAAITTYFWLRCQWSFALLAIGFIARDLLAGDELQTVLVTGGAGAVGATLGFVSARSLYQRFRTPAALVLAASSLAGIAVAALGGISARSAIAGLTFVLGFGFFLGKISLDTLVQRALGDDFRGRAFSLYDIAYNLAWVGAAGAMKVWWSPAAQGTLLVASGGIFLAGLVLIGLWFRRASLLVPLSTTAEERA
ncbi:MAG TPA: MFS transporter [Actinomycetota bacterium]|nr:MFS transporter [Actinomycetota bacterium]